MMASLLEGHLQAHPTLYRERRRARLQAERERDFKTERSRKGGRSRLRIETQALRKLWDDHRSRAAENLSNNRVLEMVSKHLAKRGITLKPSAIRKRLGSL